MATAVFLVIFTVFSLASFLVILTGADPYSSDLSVRVLFFLSLFFSITGAFSILGAWFSKIFRRPFNFLVVFRRSLFLSALAMSLILLETFSALNPLNAATSFLLIVSLELLFVYNS